MATVPGRVRRLRVNLRFPQIHYFSFGLAAPVLGRPIFGGVVLALSDVRFFTLLAAVLFAAGFFATFALLFVFVFVFVFVFAFTFDWDDGRSAAGVLACSFGTALARLLAPFARLGERIFALAATAALGRVGPSLIAAA